MKLKIPLQLFLDGIQEKKVYYFSSSEINTEIPHHFICIKRTDNDLLILSCCTSQFETVKKFIETRRMPYETLVWITPKDDANPFTKDTYINCNQYFTYTINEFGTMYSRDEIEYSGEISEHHYEQIVLGLIESPLIDEEMKDLLRGNL